MIICPGRLSTIMASNLDRCCPVVIAPRRAFFLGGGASVAKVAGFGLFSGLPVLRAKFALRV